MKYKGELLKMKANQDIRKKALEKGVRHYEVAKRLGMKSSNFSVLLSAVELPKEKKDEIFDIINQICIDKCEK